MAHNHNKSNYNKSFAIGIALNLIFISVELFYGWLANSSALIADAGHNASDVLGLIFAWIAIWLANKAPNSRYTFGLKKSTIQISILNALILFIAVGFILWDAIGKFSNPEPVGGLQVIIVAGIGVIINTITALMFVKGQKDDLNIKGAFLHMAADAAVSLGVVIAGILIMYTNLNWIDPVMSILISLVIIWSAWGLFTESLKLSLDATPKNIDITKINTSISDYSEVIRIHDLHIWALSTSENALSVHIVTEITDLSALLDKIQDVLDEQYNIKHTTIQFESLQNEQRCNYC